MKLTQLKRIDWKKHSFIKQDSDESEDEDLYFRQTNDSRKQLDSKSDQKSGQKSDQRVQVQQPDEIDTDDEINEVLDQKAKVEPEKIEPEKVEPEKVEEEEVERIIRDNPKKAVKEKVTIIKTALLVCKPNRHSNKPFQHDGELSTRQPGRWGRLNSAVMKPGPWNKASSSSSSSTRLPCVTSSRPQVQEFL